MSEIGERAAGVETDPLPAGVWLRQAAAAVAFTPSEGCCCTAFRVLHDDRWLSILAEPPDWAALRSRPAFYGIPLLAPYAFAVTGAALTYRGRQYALRPGRAGRAAHGLVRDYAWTLERTWDDADGAHLQASITTAGQPWRLAEFPFPFRLRLTATLTKTRLLTVFEATNVGEEPMPFGLGIHPYFPLPLVQAGRADTRRIRGDAPYQVAVDGGTLRMLPPEGGLDLRRGPTLAALLAAGPAGTSGRAMLVTYAGAIAEGERTRARPGLSWSLEEFTQGVDISLETSADFQVLVLFSPPDRSAISPVLSTNLPDAFDLAALGQPSGLIELAPGQTWQGWTCLTITRSP